jgi:hypothetical protein
MKLIPFLVLAGLVCFSQCGHAASRPNIVIFLADDAGWGDYSHSGNRMVRTPNIDSIASQGVSLDRFSSNRFVRPHAPSFLPDVIIRVAAYGASRPGRSG